MTIDPRLFDTFVAIAETGSFTLAAQRLDLSQSTVSAQVRRLEVLLGRELIARSTHEVALTPSGTVLLGLARDALRTRDALAAFRTGAQTLRRVRLGLCEDFSMSGLPLVLAAFARSHGAVELELEIGLSIPLYESYDAGRLDIILVKRRPRDDRGTVAWRDRLVWAGAPPLRIEADAPVPLLVFPPPSLTRSLAMAALRTADRPWTLFCTSDSLSGLHAAAAAGLGVLPHAAALLPSALGEIVHPSLPPIDDIEIVVLAAPGPPVRAALADLLLSEVRTLRTGPAATKPSDR